MRVIIGISLIAMLVILLLGNQAIAQQNDWTTNQTPAQVCPPGLDCPSENSSSLSAKGGGPRIPPIYDDLRLTNTARKIGYDTWEWTAFIDGPSNMVARIQQVTYYLHPSFPNPARIGNAQVEGHPIIATGWGTFLLEAKVVFTDGQTRLYQHHLRF